MVKRKRFSLMPVIALAALSLMISLPMLSGMRLYAAGTQHYTTITVRPGDTLWGIAAAHTAPSVSMQEMIDHISQVNHLRASTLQPGEHLRIPI